MIDFVLILIFIFGIARGLKRGFILQFFQFTGFIVAFIVAKAFYKELSTKLILWIPYPSIGNSDSIKMLFDTANIEDTYYLAIAFVILFFVVKIVWQIIGSMIDFVASLPILKQLNRWGGGVFGLFETYLVLFIVLYILALLPVQSIQSMISYSSIAQAMIEHTPYFSSEINELWFEYLSK